METQQHKSGKLEHMFHAARKFFQRIRLVFAAMATFHLATGITAAILSAGSNGTSQIPYFIGAFLAGCWDVLLVVLCQIAMHYLSMDTRKMPKAAFWCTAFTIACSMLVIFNVMCIIFCVTNGLCLHDQQCFYDKNHGGNRTLAILIIVQLMINIVNILFANCTAFTIACSMLVIFNVMCIIFCVTNGLCLHDQQCFYDKNHGGNRTLAILIIVQLMINNIFNILFAKRAHAIDTELGSDITIKLGQYMNIFRDKISRKPQSSGHSTTSISTLGSCSSLHKAGQAAGADSGLSEADKEKVIAHVMAQRKWEQQHRSKSNPNLHKHHHHEPYPEHHEPEGKVFSIYSDSETISIDSRRKKKYSKQKRRNLVKPSPDAPENSSKSSPENGPDYGAVGLTGRSEDSGVSFEDDKWSSFSSTSTFRPRPANTAGIASGANSVSDITETDSDVVRYKKHLEHQQNKEDLRLQMLDRQMALLEKDKQNPDVAPAYGTPPPPYEEIPQLPNVVLNIQPSQPREGEMPMSEHKEDLENHTEV